MKSWCRVALFGAVLVAFFQFDGAVRRWEVRALAAAGRLLRDRVGGVPGAGAGTGQRGSRPPRPAGDRPTGFAKPADSAEPSSPSAVPEPPATRSSASVLAESYGGEFPGDGWYGVQAWEGLHPHPYTNLSKLDGLRCVRIASREEWWSWSFGACPATQFPEGHEGRWTMVTTDGVRHDAPQAEEAATAGW